MPEHPPPSPEELARQARQHLDSLRAAGVGWLPNPPLPAAPAPPEPERPRVTLRAASPAEPAPGPVLQPLIFQGAPAPGQAPAGDAQQRLQALQELAGRVSQCVRCK